MSYSFLTKSAKIKLKSKEDGIQNSYSFLTKSAKIKHKPSQCHTGSGYSFLTKSAKIKLKILLIHPFSSSLFPRIPLHLFASQISVTVYYQFLLLQRTFERQLLRIAYLRRIVIDPLHGVLLRKATRRIISNAAATSLKIVSFIFRPSLIFDHGCYDVSRACPAPYRMPLPV